MNHVAAKKTGFKPDEWNTFVIRADGDRWIVNLNGERILEAQDDKSLSGIIGLQYNAGKKIEFRNIKLKPLD